MLLTYAVAASLGLILDVVQKPWRRLKRWVLRTTGTDDEQVSGGVVESKRERRESVKVRGNILPLTRLNGKEREESE